jgi:ATP-dependent Clp protease ATP-binding subunit ClpA
MELAVQGALELKHGYFSTEHILLGLINDETFATLFREEYEVLPENLRKDIEKIIEPGCAVVVNEDIPGTPGVNRVIEYSRVEAERCGRDVVEASDILVGLLRESNGVGAQVLMNNGLRLEEVREKTLRLVRSGNLEGKVASVEDSEVKGDSDYWLTPKADIGFRDFLKAKGYEVPLSKDEGSIQFGDEFVGDIYLDDSVMVRYDKESVSQIDCAFDLVKILDANNVRYEEKPSRKEALRVVESHLDFTQGLIDRLMGHD